MSSLATMVAKDLSIIKEILSKKFLYNESPSIINSRLIGNLGSLVTIPTGATSPVVAASARTRDGNTLPMVITIIDFDQNNIGTKAAIIQFGGGGVTNGTGLIDIGQGKSFTVHASELRVSVLSIGQPGNSRIGAYISEGEKVTDPLAIATPGVIAAGANQAVTLQPMCNEVMFVPEQNSTWLIEFRRSDAVVINRITLAANVITPWIPVHSNMFDILITSLNVVDNIIYAYQKLHM